MAGCSKLHHAIDGMSVAINFNRETDIFFLYINQTFFINEKVDGLFNCVRIIKTKIKFARYILLLKVTTYVDFADFS